MSSFFNILDRKTSASGNESCFPSLSFTERLIGFGLCTGLGFIIQIMSFGSIFGVVTGSPTKFAISYSIGNILAIAGTGFLMGFKKQIQDMVNNERLVTTLLFIGSLIMTLVSALLFQSPLLIIIFLVIQICSYIWYCASYIPFAQTCIKNCLQSVVKK